MTARAPTDTQRTMIIGRTGTGKSQFGLSLLSAQDWDKKPWVMIDYKGEDLIADILKQNKGAVKRLSLDNNPPKAPGLYHLPAQPVANDEAMIAWLLKVHKQGSIGLFIDEGYAMPKCGDEKSFTMILTQGRSLHIPVICLYQRPVWMSRFAIAQADFISVFKQGDERDEKITKNFCRPAILPNGEKLGPMDLDKLPDYYSLWHDVSRGSTSVLKPAPSRNSILATFKTRLNPQRKGTLV